MFEDDCKESEIFLKSDIITVIIGRSAEKFIEVVYESIFTRSKENLIHVFFIRKIFIRK